MKTFILFILISLMMLSTGCMQVLGAKKLDAWGLKIDANSGLEVSGGIMQYDQANNTKVMGK